MRSAPLLLPALVVAVIAPACGHKAVAPPAVKAVVDTGPTWVNETRKFEDRPVILRLNRRLKKMIGDARFAYQAGVQVRYSTPPTGHPLPTTAQTRVLRQIEDELAESLGDTPDHLFAAIVDIDGSRTFVYYTSEHETFESLVVDLRRKFAQFPIEVHVGPDAKWTVYQGIVGGTAYPGAKKPAVEL